jgi:hypothetical protein
MGKRIGLFFLSLVLSIGLCEGLLRVFWENPYRNEIPDHLVKLAIHHPFRDLPVDRSAIGADPPIVPLRTDGRGYILPSHQFEAPDVTIAFLGGSTTECAAVAEEVRFPALVSTLLGEHGLRVNTLNAAKSGNTVQDSLNVFLNRIVEDRPDIAVMMHAANDIGILAAFDSYRPRSGAPASLRTALVWLFQGASARSSIAGAVRMSISIRPLRGGGFEHRAALPRERAVVRSDEFVHRLRSFVGIARGFRIVPVLMTQPLITMITPLTPDWTDPRNQEIFNQLIRDVAQEEDVVLIDLAKHVLENVEGWDEPMRVFYDGAHVSDEGSRVYAEYIARRLLDSVLRPPLVEAPRPPA